MRNPLTLLRRHAPRLGARLAAVIGLASLSGSAFAAPLGGSIGSSMLQAVCSFINSPIIVIVFIIAIVGVILLMVLGEGRGTGQRFVHIILGAAVILGIGVIIRTLGFTQGCA